MGSKSNINHGNNAPNSHLSSSSESNHCKSFKESNNEEEEISINYSSLSEPTIDDDENSKLDARQDVHVLQHKLNENSTHPTFNFSKYSTRNLSFTFQKSELF
jgi:hypothetical protein